MFRLAIAALAAAALIVAPAYATSAKSTALEGQTGPGFKVEVEKGGKDLKTIKAGTYKIKVEDKSSIHNFHLIGPGLNKKTSVSFVGDQTWTIKLKPGRVTYQCDIHLSEGMKGSFKVTK
jgi:plastocyanin